MIERDKTSVIRTAKKTTLIKMYNIAMKLCKSGEIRKYKEKIMKLQGYHSIGNNKRSLMFYLATCDFVNKDSYFFNSYFRKKIKISFTRKEKVSCINRYYIQAYEDNQRIRQRWKNIHPALRSRLSIIIRTGKADELLDSNYIPSTFYRERISNVNKQKRKKL